MSYGQANPLVGGFVVTSQTHPSPISHLRIAEQPGQELSLRWRAHPTSRMFLFFLPSQHFNEWQGLKSCSQADQYPRVINDTPSSYADFQHGSELFTRQSLWAPAISSLRFTPMLSPLSCREKGKLPTAPQDLKI